MKRPYRGLVRLYTFAAVVYGILAFLRLLSIHSWSGAARVVPFVCGTAALFYAAMAVTYWRLDRRHGTR